MHRGLLLAAVVCMVAVSAITPSSSSSQRFSLAHHQSRQELTEALGFGIGDVKTCRKAIDKMYNAVRKHKKTGKGLLAKIGRFFKDAFASSKKLIMKEGCGLVKNSAACHRGFECAAKVFKFETAMLAGKSKDKVLALCTDITSCICSAGATDTSNCAPLPPGLDFTFDTLKPLLVAKCEEIAGKGHDLYVMGLKQAKVFATEAELKVEAQLEKAALAGVTSEITEEVMTKVEAAGGVQQFVSTFKASVIDGIVSQLLSTALDELQEQMETGGKKLEGLVKGSDVNAQLGRAGVQVGVHIGTQMVNLAIQKVMAKIGCDLQLDEADHEAAAASP